MRLVVVLVLASARSRPPVHVFTCRGGVKLEARYADDRVALRLPDGTVTLSRARSASGARYANDSLELWEHAGEARVTRRGTVVLEGCRPGR